MKVVSCLAVLVLCTHLLQACTRPVAVVHLSAKEAALTRKKGYGFPKHTTLSRYVCFNEKCLGRAEWKNRQQKRKFKGYKNDGPVRNEKKDREFSNQ
jgi:hypothetical protein